MGRNSHVLTRRQRHEQVNARKAQDKLHKTALRADPAFRANENARKRQRRTVEKEERERLRSRVEELEETVEELEERVALLTAELERYRTIYENYDDEEEAVMGNEEAEEPMVAVDEPMTTGEQRTEEPGPAVQGLEAVVAASQGAEAPQEDDEGEDETGAARELNDFGKEVMKACDIWLGVDKETLEELISKVRERLHLFKVTGSPRKNRAPEKVSLEEAEVISLLGRQKKKKKKKKKNKKKKKKWKIFTKIFFAKYFFKKYIFLKKKIFLAACRLLSFLVTPVFYSRNGITALQGACPHLYANRKEDRQLPGNHIGW
jgi:hypothetical protein